MKNHFLLILLLATFSLAAQKGAAPLPSTLNRPPSTATRAVVIGISDYADDRIPDLQFADRDAEAFAAWLQSPAGGSLPAGQISLLLNEQATLGKMVAAFDWLIAKSKPGDRACIYFSGHGDVEKVTKFNRGYLLAYDMPGTTYMAGGMNLRDLQDIVATLSDAGVQVVLISDACRAGKLAGSENGGTQATAAALSQQFAKEIKILSCQPDEYSLEGEQWGGGRGCFSFHLTDGLTGMADQNADLTVELREISRYLQDKVSAEASPSRQMPVTVGNAFAPVASVDEPTLKDLLKRKEQEAPTLLTIKSKGMEDLLLASADTSVQELYKAFAAAVERGELLQAAFAGQSANDYFERLMQAPGIEDLQGMVKRNFAAALQDEAQVVVNKLLRTDPQVVDEAFPGRVRYAHLPAYLARAAEILGEKHYMYRYLKCKQYFFEAKTYTKVTYPELPPDSLLRLSLRTLDKALVFDSSAAYVWLEKGLNYYWKTVMVDSSQLYFRKAIQFSPTWVLALYFYGRLSLDIAPDEGIFILKNALKLDTTFLPIYERLCRYATPEGSEFWQNQYVRKMQEMINENPDEIPAVYYRYLAWTYYAMEKYNEMEKAALKFGQMTNYEEPIYWKMLGEVYINLEKNAEGVNAYQKYIELRPDDHEGLWAWLRLQGWLHQFDEYRKNANRAIEIMEKKLWGESERGTIYWLGGKPDKAESLFKSYLQQTYDSAFFYSTFFTSPHWIYNQLGWVMYVQGKVEEAEKWWLQGDSITTENSPAKFGLSFLAYQRGQYQLAEEHFDRAMKLWWYDHASHILSDGFTLLVIYGKVEETEYLFSKALKYYPTHAPLHYHLARLHLEQKNDYPAGVPLLEKAVQLDSTHAYAHYHLAAAYAHLGKNKAALEYLEMALEKGYEDFEQMEKDARWERLRGTKRYKTLMQKYFPKTD